MANLDIVLISGKAGSGKTTTSKYLFDQAKRVGYDWALNLKFAGKLYEIHDQVLMLMQTFTGVQMVKKDGILLQLLGTEWGRKVFGQDVWCNILKIEIDRIRRIHDEERGLIIVDDCRFVNEFEAFPEALRVRLEAKEEIRKDRADSWRPNTQHESEINLDQYYIEDKFDLSLRTDNPNYTVEHTGCLILAQLRKGTWKEKRNA